ncbi:hypothetical protein FQP90_19220 [Paenarthrobacter nitroguajacolicus]|uniref:Uncharacterized protein n=1 Tax=Paenarthrobacter nitroguajacolicus TaxID=211146 RepID=A0A558GRM5_PAENT|nr:hypothetical protein [Paenarthrobacter nitroguajacolicus]TVU59528.1 hypothetical protein FQP90_19220 [Paenarthrobacter nitroguajacolicus]
MKFKRAAASYFLPEFSTTLSRVSVGAGVILTSLSFSALSATSFSPLMNSNGGFMTSAGGPAIASSGCTASRRYSKMTHPRSSLANVPTYYKDRLREAFRKLWSSTDRPDVRTLKAWDGHMFFFISRVIS